MEVNDKLEHEERETAGNEIRSRVIEAVRSVYDPEIPVNIYELGLIYRLDISPDATVTIDLTLTSPHCPVAGTLPGEVEQKVRSVSGVKEVKLELVWDPPWNTDMMSEEAKLQLGLF
ncbi:MAG: SUF system Fe-S cluster assembly protein [Acidobacteriota bacterium]